MKTFKTILKWTGILVSVVLAIFLLHLIIPEKETVQPITPRESTEYREMSEGFKIAYTKLSGGDSLEKAPVLFLHGGPGGYVHSSIIETLGPIAQDERDVYLYDQRGSGLSDRLKRFSDVNAEKHLLDLHEIITQKIGAQKVILMGQSFGCILAAHYSARHPERVAKLIFSSPGTLLPHRMVNGNYVDLDSIYPPPDSLPFKKPFDFIRDVDRTAMKPKAMVATVGALLFDRKLISDEQMDRMLNTLASKFTRGMVCDPGNVLPEEGGGGLYAFLATNNGDLPEIRGKIRSLDVPVLVLQGQCEYHPYASAYEYVDVYPTSQYSFIEGAGHEIWWEQREEFIQRISLFLSQ